MQRPAIGISFLAIALLAAPGCDEGGGPGVGIVPGGSTTLIRPSDDGNGQIGDPGAVLPAPLKLLVFRNGDPAVGVEIAWSTTDGSIFPATMTTNNTGLVLGEWTLPDTAGEARVVRATARVAGGGPSSQYVGFAVPAAHAVVEVTDGAFDAVRPTDPLQVAAGTTVTWVWPVDAVNHNVAPTGGGTEPTRSGDAVDGPATFSWTFAAAGTYTYACESHPAVVAEVVVQ